MSTPDEPPAADQPSEPIAQASGTPGVPDQPEAPGQRTRIIRRAPTGPIATSVDPPTTHIPRRPALEHDHARTGLSPFDEPSSRTAVAACAVSMISGWATSVVATDLIDGWWSTNVLFCLAIAFLALVFAVSTVSGVILLLQRRPIGRYLIVVGAVVALLTYCGIFIADARVAWIVYTLPLLPLASVVLALHPNTKRWLQE